MKEITDNLEFIKIKNCFVKDKSGELEDKPQFGRRYLQKTYLIRDLLKIHKELLKLNNNKIIKLKNKSSSYTNTSPKKIYRWQT